MLLVGIQVLIDVASCLTWLSWFSFELVIEGVGESDCLTRFTWDNFFDDDDRDEDELEECEPGDVSTFGLIRVESSLVFGEFRSVFIALDLIVLFVGVIDPFKAASVVAARSRSMFCSCWCERRNEFKICSLCNRAAAIADELSFVGNWLDEPLTRGVVGSKFSGKLWFVPGGTANKDAKAAGKRCRSNTDNDNGSRPGKFTGGIIEGNDAEQWVNLELSEWCDFMFGDVRLRWVEFDDDGGGGELIDELL